jgi:hypothetical protein
MKLCAGVYTEPVERVPLRFIMRSKIYRAANDLLSRAWPELVEGGLKNLASVSEYHAHTRAQVCPAGALRKIRTKKMGGAPLVLPYACPDGALRILFILTEPLAPLSVGEGPGVR